MEIVVERLSVRIPGAVHGGLVILWDAGGAPCGSDEIVEGGGYEEIFLGVVEEGTNEGTKDVDDLDDAISDVLCENSAVEVVVKETGRVGESRDVLGEIVEEGYGCGVGGCRGLECDGKLGGEVVDECEKRVNVCDDDMERCRVDILSGNVVQGSGAGLVKERERRLIVVLGHRGLIM